MFDLRRLELHSHGISMTGKPVDNWTSWIPHAKQLSDFIEGFPRRIVACLPNVFVGPTISARFGAVEMGMSTRNHERQHWKVRPIIAFLALLQQHSMNMPFEVIHGNERLIERERQCL